MAFQKGQSGNPNGKPKGTRHRVTVAAEALMEGEAEAITRKVIELAKEGDGPALRLCMDRIYPPRKDRPVRFSLPSLDKVEDAVAAHAAIVAGGDNGGCGGRDHESGLRGDRSAFRPNGRSDPINPAAAVGAAIRQPLSGFSPGISQEAPWFVRG